MTLPLFLLSLMSVASAQFHLTDGDYLIELVNSRQSSWKAHHNFKREILPHFVTKLVGVQKFNSPGFNEINSSESSVPKAVRLRKYQANREDSFDARVVWANCTGIGKVRDQGACSSGWAVAVASTLSDRFCIATNGEFTKDLSAQDLLECCTLCGDCSSGDPKLAWYDIVYNGVVTGGDYNSREGCKPYEFPPCEHSIFSSNLSFCASTKTPVVNKCRKNCAVENTSVKYATDVHLVKSVEPKNNVSAMLADIVANGPLQASMNIYEDMLYYKSGVYTHVAGNRIGSQAVKIIGWGVEEGEDETPYWLVVNSWNVNWGESGLFKILRGQNECGIEASAYSPLPDLSTL